MDITYSVNQVPIRLTYERWYHIVENHDELASHFHDVLETVENPQVVTRGNRGAFKAARKIGKRKWLISVYRELSANDGSSLLRTYLIRNREKRSYGDLSDREYARPYKQVHRHCA